jgi:hypothetical protein
MSLLTAIRDLFIEKAPAAKAAPVAITLSGRPSYAGAFGSFGALPRDQSFQLLDSFWRNIPPLKQAVSVLAGFAGSPEFLCQSDSDTLELNTWAKTVAYGHAGSGLCTWVDDMCGQSLRYGYAVGEAEIDPARREVPRLWSYASGQCGFRSDPGGGLQVLQQKPSVGLQPLNPETAVSLTHDPTACGPYGESLFLAIPTVAGIWMDILHNHRQTWRRSGTPSFHVNCVLPDTLDDADGSIGQAVVNALSEQWNAGMKSAVIDGKVQDFVTAGRITVTVIGADGQVMDIQVSKRNIMEEILVALGLPPWLLGYSWSTTERLSTQQADMLLAKVDTIRRELEAPIRFVTDLRLRLQARRVPYELVWPDVNLQDVLQTAQAEAFAATAALNRQRVNRQRWADGIYTQEQYAEEETESPAVAVSYDGPQALPGGNAGAVPGQAQLAVLTDVEKEARGEYPDLWERATCNGRH